MNTLYKVFVVVALAISAFAVSVRFDSGSLVGGATNFDSLDLSDGLLIDGTTVINGSGAWTGTLSSAAALSATGDVRLNKPVQTGSVTALTGNATSSVTAANVCDASVLTRNPLIADSSTTLPSAANMFADCLTTNGDRVSVVLRNISNAASTTIVVAGASTTLVGTTANDDIVDGGNETMLTFVRASATELLVVIEEMVAAD